MNNKTRLLLIVVASILMSGLVQGFEFGTTYTCPLEECIEGQLATWNVTVFNAGGRFVEIVAVSLVDAVTGEKTAEKRFSFDFANSARGEVFMLHAAQKLNVGIVDEIPRANSYGDQFVYYPCITTVIRDPLEVARYGEHESTHCYSVNLSMTTYGCLANDHCSADQVCQNTRCRDLNCGDCHFIQDHECFAYECCQAQHCAENQLCQDNTCQNIFCSPTQYLYNRTCVELNCGPDEYIFNKACHPLNCAPDEYALNHSCQPLTCASHEIISNHQCVPLDCLPHEHAQNHTCQPLNCRSHEKIEHHECKPLECAFFQFPDNHECNMDVFFLVKIVLEIIILGLIVWFVILDLKKHKLKSQKNPSKKTPLTTKGKKL